MSERYGKEEKSGKKTKIIDKSSPRLYNITNAEKVRSSMTRMRREKAVGVSFREVSVKVGPEHAG